ncbi:MAG TPA: VWA domain-containing protein [Acidobacteriaceae bacterium]|jgi:VWFA-related protein
MRLLHFFCLPLTAIAVFAQTPAPSSQSSQQSPPVGYVAPLFNATTRNVILDAVVTDKKGNVVTGLTRNEFAIREDNSPQEIRSFDAVTAGAAAEEATPHTILLVDELNTHFEDMAYTRYSVNRLLHHDGVQLDQPTALYILSNDGLHVLQNYTRDPAAIDAALHSHKAVLPWRLRRNFYLALDRINISMSALDQIAIANSGVPGHKNIVWISPGLPLFGGLELTGDSEKQLFDSIRHLSDQLLKARISIYSVDPRGVGSQFGPTNFASSDLAYTAYLNGLSDASDAAFGNLAIQALATQTGGHAFYGRNDVDREIATSLTDGDTYYTLAYSPSNKDFHGEFRKVRITVIDRPDLKVQTREGYYAIPDNQPADPKRDLQELAGSLLTPIPFNGVPIPTSDIKLFKSPVPHISVRFVVPSTSLSWRQDAKGGLSSQVSIAGADRTKHGAWKASIVRVYTVSLPGGTSPSARTLTSMTFEMPYRDSNHLRFVLRDDTSGHVGSSEIEIDPSRIS